MWTWRRGPSLTSPMRCSRSARSPRFRQWLPTMRDARALEHFDLAPGLAAKNDLVVLVDNGVASLRGRCG